jgi:hypothetical protein
MLFSFDEVMYKGGYFSRSTLSFLPIRWIVLPTFYGMFRRFPSWTWLVRQLKNYG